MKKWIVIQALMLITLLPAMAASGYSASENGVAARHHFIPQDTKAVHATKPQAQSSAQASAPQYPAHSLDDTLSASVLTATAPNVRNSTQTGLVHIDPTLIKQGAASFGTPDVIKTLLTLPGVSAGNELMGGMYVHGGDGTDNLYLLDGVPLYNISHFGGIFSSFNTDIVKGLDFYKSGFPARYGGKLSSVVDVQSAEGDLQKYHGSISLGLIDGRINVSGPIYKGKTTFNLAYRRSWMDMMIALAMKFYKGEGPRKAAYFMNDLNAGVTHHFSKDNNLSANFYWGLDKLDLGLQQDKSSMDLKEKWGSLAGSVVWNHGINSKIRHSHRLFYSQSTSDTDYGIAMNAMNLTDFIGSGIKNVGLRNGIDWYPTPNQHIRAGIDADCKMYRYVGQAEDPGNPDSPSPSLSYNAGEVSAYMEDEFFITWNFSLNAGLRYTAYIAPHKAWHSIEPRAALKWEPTDWMELKFSYTRMSQGDHLVASTYIDLPSNAWMPSTSKIRPVMSDQVSGGVYFKPITGMKINLEGWYKTMNNLLYYVGPNSMFPPVQNWERSFTTGKGDSYGLETELSWSNKRLSATAYYTLSWSRRNFPTVYPGWFWANNDNRHKVNLLFSLNVFKGLNLYLNWNYHTGNRVTLPSNSSADGAVFYGEPYNFSLPDYHRMDVGITYTHPMKVGAFEVNASVYNLYNHHNAFFAFVSSDPATGKIKGTAYSVLPVFPTVSISYQF